MGSIKQNFRRFFGTNRASDSGIELLQKFILPFAKVWNPLASVDDAVAAFFALEDRKIVKGRALRKFRMPGSHMRIGGFPTKRFKIRDVPEGTEMLLVLDRKDQITKVDVRLDGEDLTFLLERFEMEALKDRIQIYE